MPVIVFPHRDVIERLPADRLHRGERAPFLPGGVPQPDAEDEVTQPADHSGIPARSNGFCNKRFRLSALQPTFRQPAC
jgi:hypothetical protein